MVDSGYSPPLVVDLGADAPVPVRARSWIAVPLRAHAVVAPRPGQAEEANLLQHAVLGLLRAGVREPSDLGQRLVVRRELVEIVLGDLLSEGWVDDERMLLPAGELALQEPGGSLDYRQLWAFQEPWTGRLLPRFAEHLEAAEVLQRGNGTIKAIIGPVGNPREEEATEISLRSDEYRSLGLEEVAIAYGDFQDQNHRADVAAGGANWQGALQEPRMALVDGRVRDVLALTFCFTSDRLPRERQWDVADPMGRWWLNALSDCLDRDAGPQLRDVIAGLLRQRGGRRHTDPARRRRRHERGERVAERGLEPPAVDALADAWTDASETLVGVETERRKLEEELEPLRRDPQPRAHHLARLLDEATGRVLVLAEETLRQALRAAPHGSGADLSFSLLQAEKYAYGEAARRTGFSELHDVFVVRGRRSIQGAGQPTDESGDPPAGGAGRPGLANRLPELILSNLARAVTDPEHGLRALAQRRPGLLMELGRLVEQPGWVERLESDLDPATDSGPRDAILRRLGAEAVAASEALEELSATLALGESPAEKERDG